MEMTSKVRARLRSEAQRIETTLRAGKSGITDTLVVELREQLKRRGLVKVGLQPSATADAGRDAVAEELAARAGAMLVEVRGNTAVYFKPGVAR